MSCLRKHDPVYEKPIIESFTAYLGILDNFYNVHASYSLWLLFTANNSYVVLFFTTQLLYNFYAVW
jgi:hypothetical protein